MNIAAMIINLFVIIDTYRLRKILEFENYFFITDFFSNITAFQQLNKEKSSNLKNWYL